jgi:hypothetical protein
MYDRILSGGLHCSLWLVEDLSLGEGIGNLSSRLNTRLGYQIGLQIRLWTVV